jgi:hypothetical protein
MPSAFVPETNKSVAKAVTEIIASAAIRATQANEQGRHHKEDKPIRNDWIKQRGPSCGYREQVEGRAAAKAGPGAMSSGGAKRQEAVQAKCADGARCYQVDDYYTHHVTQKSAGG